MDLLEEGIIAEEHELKMEDEISGYLLETGRWTKFIAITFYILLGIIALLILFFKEDVIGGGYDFDNRFTRTLIILGISTVIVVVTFYFLINFANKIKAGIAAENIETVNKGLLSLKTHLIIIGILTLLRLAYQFYQMLNH